MTYQSHGSTLYLLLRLWSRLKVTRRRQLLLLLIVMLISGLAELLSLGAVLPFLGVLSEPERLWSQPFIQDIGLVFGIKSANQLVLPATLVFATAAVFAAFIRLSNLWLNVHLAAAIGSDLSCEAYRRTLFQPYETHIMRNTSSVMTSTISQINFTVVAINSFLQLLTSLIVASGLFFGLLLINYGVALFTAFVFAIAYVLLAFTSRYELRLNGYKIADATREQLKAFQEGIGAIRDILLDGTQNVYLKIYRDADIPQRQLQAKNSFLTIYPRYALEALGILIIAILGCLLVSQNKSDTALIPLLGALALGSQRLLPALQGIYRGWASLKNYNAAIGDVLSIIEQPMPASIVRGDTIRFSKSIKFEEINYRYSSNSGFILKSVNLEILCGERIGVVGVTGSGKSTFVDLLMGLLSPTTGRILVDGVDIHSKDHPENIDGWRANIAHVPQSIFLSDSSIAENIAFGVPKEEIDMTRVQSAAQRAQLSGFINSCKEGYNLKVGERGARLSGGQLQRLGIARALYKNASILILDEATSALDAKTEESVMTAINDLSKELTIIMIAHRLTTIESCNRILSLEQGTFSVIDASSS